MVSMHSHEKKERHIKVCILGAGISGLSSSYHIGHQFCEIFEKEVRIGGLLQTEDKNNFTWDRGPHVSFTKNEYVKNLFSKNVDCNYDEFEVKIENYFKGHWIPHPAQLNYHAIPSPMKEICLSSFIDSLNIKNKKINNYEEWLEGSFGIQFAKNFPMEYTKKYWTIESKYLDTDWIGVRVKPPTLEDVIRGLDESSRKTAHYIQSVRYPKQGGYYSFIKKIAENSTVHLRQIISHIDLKHKKINMVSGMVYSYEKLISTIPLPDLVRLGSAPSEIQVAAAQLSCTSVLLVNICTPRLLKRDIDWFYVYDASLYSTRVSILRMSQSNSDLNDAYAIQVEVYFSEHKMPDKSMDEISKIVASELMHMGLIDEVKNTFWRFIPFANVIFDKPRKNSQNKILKWLESQGLVREGDDLDPMTSWSDKPQKELGDLILSGRFAQWKYYWTDDCVLRSKYIADSLKTFGNLI
jgi:protoporphyrinogen oxidase